MDKTFEVEIIDRLSRIEEAVKNREELCATHKGELVTLKKDIDGNGKPGIKKELNDLKTEFIRFETKILAYATIGSAVGGLAITIFMKKVVG